MLLLPLRHARSSVSRTPCLVKLIRPFAVFPPSQQRQRLPPRDPFAKYRRPPLLPPTPPLASNPSLPASLAEIAPADRSDAYKSASTQPAGTSFQQVPAPLSPAESGASHLQVPVPAMKDVPPQAQSLTGKKEMVVQGVVIPAKPVPPGEEECCMSGCVHCVYTIYAEEVEAYTEAVAAARAELLAAKVPEEEWPDAVREGGEGTKEEAQSEIQRDVDPSMAAFLALEGKLQKKQAPESSAAT